MRSRIFGIKKSILLWISAITLFLLFVASTTLTLYFLKIPDLWFYNFCFCIGIYQTIKSKFFNLDSSFYLGCNLANISAAGFIFWLTDTISFAPAYILLSFALASLLTLCVSGQKFHLVIFFSLIFVTLYTYLLIKKLITLPIFIAFTIGFLVLLILELIIFIKRRN